MFNLCSHYDYQSKGYYISLLAAARDHRVIPTVAALQDFSNTRFTKCLSDEISLLLNEELNGESEDYINYEVFLGHELNGQATKLSKKLYMLFEAPYLSFTFVKIDKWLIQNVEIRSVNDLKLYRQDILKQIATLYFNQYKFNRPKLKNYEYDLAILINPSESNPLSNAEALRKFKEAGEKHGFFVEFITNEDIHRINEFDALFIRETTAVNNHTYQIARYAHAEGLVVIDDPWSILKCSNKFYLQERMRKAKIPMPQSRVLKSSDNLLSIVAQSFGFPMILKQLDSAFSLGVHKVSDLNELIMKCDELFVQSEFVIAQKFKPSEFDWRIGVLDNRIIFASKYYMAKGHWQIYNWQSELSDPSGDSETLPIHQVPKLVLDTALKATSFIGDGLYGVDIKMIDGKCYLIEINDNPNIDCGIEDLIVDDELYSTIIESIKTRIIKTRNLNRYISL